MSNTSQIPSQLYNPFSALFKHIWHTSFWLGVIAILFGIVFLADTPTSTVVLAIFFAVYLIVSGLFFVIGAFTIHQSVAWRVLNFVTGAISILLGAASLSPVDGIVTLGIFIGITWIFQGISALSVFISEPHLPGRVFNIILSVITVIAGFVVVTAPFPSAFILVQVSGVFIIVMGIFQIIAAFAIKKDSKV